MMTILNYLDFGSIFVNDIIGDPMLAYIILMIILVISCIKLGFNEKITAIMFVIGSILYVSQYYSVAISLAVIAMLFGFIRNITKTF